MTTEERLNEYEQLFRSDHVAAQTFHLQHIGDQRFHNAVLLYHELRFILFRAVDLDDDAERDRQQLNHVGSAGVHAYKHQLEQEARDD